MATAVGVQNGFYGYCQRLNSLVLESGLDVDWLFSRMTHNAQCLLEIRVIVADLRLSVESAVVDTLRIRLLCFCCRLGVFTTKNNS